MGKSVMGYMAAVVSVVILLGVMVEKSMYHVPSGDAVPYHNLVKSKVEGLSLEQGDWIGETIDVPPAAVALLKPNVLMNRQYIDVKTRRLVSFLLVQCGDARDLLGHYPPACYPASGWLSLAKRPRDWQVDDLIITGMQYEFTRSSFDGSKAIVIYNFMILPDGTLGRDMNPVNELAQDYRRKFYGAAQVQLVFDGSAPESERDRIMTEMIQIHSELLDVIRDGVKI